MIRHMTVSNGIIFTNYVGVGIGHLNTIKVILER